MKMFLSLLAVCFSFNFIASAEEVTRKEFGDWSVITDSEDCLLSLVQPHKYSKQNAIGQKNVDLSEDISWLNEGLMLSYSKETKDNFIMLYSVNWETKKGWNKVIFNFDQKVTKTLDGISCDDCPSNRAVAFVFKQFLREIAPSFKKFNTVEVTMNGGNILIPLGGFSKAYSGFESCLKSSNVTLEKVDPFD